MEDGFAAFESLNVEAELRSVFVVEHLSCKLQYEVTGLCLCQCFAPER